MALHSYTPTEWKNAPDHKTTPINATNLNNIEDGIANAYTDIEDITTGDIGIAFDNTGTDLVAETAQAAIVELDTNKADRTELISGDIDEVLSIVSSTGSKSTSQDMSKYKFLVLALRGATNGAWAITHTIPYKLFKDFNSSNQAVQVEFATSSVIATVHYIDDTHVYVDALTSNRGFSIWGVK